MEQFTNSRCFCPALENKTNCLLKQHTATNYTKTQTYMHFKQLHPFLFFTALLAACNDSSESSNMVAADNISSAPATASTASTTTSSNAVAVSTDAAAIAVIENDQVRFKLHSLPEVVPDAGAPGKPAPGTKVYAADISVEYLKGHEKSAAEYLLSSYIIDDKGNKYSLPLGSTRLAMVVSEAQAQLDNAAGAAFNESNPPTGKKYRGRQYGFEMEAANKPVKWGMMLNGKEMQVGIR
jgi:hypothetical protein